MKDLQHLGDMDQDDVILTGLPFDHTAMITLSVKKNANPKFLALTWYLMITIFFGVWYSFLTEFCLLQKNAEKIPSYKFLPLMYQLAARMGTKMMGGLGFHEVLNNVIYAFCI